MRSSFDPVPRRLVCLRPLPAIAALVALLQAGCTTVGPRFERPPSPAPAAFAQWHGGDAALAAPADVERPETTMQRWAALGDPTTDRLLALAGAGNLDLQVAATRVLEARALEATAAAQRGPQVSAQAAASRQRLSENGSATRLVSALPGAEGAGLRAFLGEPFSLYQSGFDASWELDLWGRVRRSVEAARAQTEEAEANQREMRLVIVAEMFKAHAQLRSLQGQLAAARIEAGAARRAAALLSAQVDGGLVDTTPLLRQQQQVAALDAQVDALVVQVAAAMNRITLLCGQVPGSLNGLLGADTDGSLPATPDLRLGLPSTLLRRRPDVAAAEARLSGAIANVGVAVADLYPRVTLGASFGFESLRDDQAFDWSSRQWSAGPSLVLPVFDQGRRRSTIELREHQQQEAALAYRQVVLNAWHEVDDALSAYASAGRDVDNGAAVLRDASRTLDVVRTRRQLGLTDELPEMAAMQVRAQAQRALAESQGRHRLGLIAVYKALGSDETLPAAGS